jgi:two-component system heavy metal sensor histidine kinase CusS
MFGHEGLLFLVVGGDGRVLVRNAAFKGTVPAANVVPADRVPTFSDVRDWRVDNTSWRSLAAQGVISDSAGEQVIIVVARDASERSALMREYGADLILAALVGSLMATFLGFVTVRNGLRPIGTVAKKANEITSRRLDARLRVEEAPAELYELTRAFNAMLERLEDGMKRLSRFAADLAHDLRTPVNALMVNTQVALSRPRTVDEYRSLLETNIEDFERLSRLIESTLFLARADNEQVAVTKQPIDVRRTLDKVTDYFSGIGEEAGVLFSVTGDGVVLGDEVLVERAVSNLISNAIRHTGPQETVRIAVTDTADAVEIAVENPGPGIPPNQLERVFDRYFRGDASRSQASGSAGLGLAIVRAIMALHGGSATVASEVNGISRFTLTFPKAPLARP